uniref:RING-type domain-containing protein n=1 Tax=Lotharella oceanica TaxID=641309 RepID=A0A7S2TPS6_9EUKA|mmetsp:Transcript_24309/g.45488  ORF Transcript_24309/g.45488 Transcript_24309/m.45488 type:complete len:310 (+) Transcript_24309:153-1082(+)|eukprot:CAMPEP_0170176872 /NCGR_PEP_ID=MMETSP0040_2-20121228/9638_1 /TAXON_ID=641309 /ORGANISM="Lotharella oceanica, Strain CCMP622" /LENGTH=309 /DNA_ID=CAMNT_0010419325 /DNA_START=153 /DNA_END=1082 /DNA_ORIENTATION=+
MPFKCNRCFATISKQAFVTSCSHIFCFKCSKDWFQRHQDCPQCKTTLKSENDLRGTQLDVVDLAPVSMKLWGLSPAQIMEVCGGAIAFWEYQKKHEIAYRVDQVSRKDKRNRQIVTSANEKLVKAKNMIASLHQKNQALIENLRRANEDNGLLKRELKEKSRQKEKYSAMYNQIRSKAMRLQSLSPDQQSRTKMIADTPFVRPETPDNVKSLRNLVQQTRRISPSSARSPLRRSPTHRSPTQRSPSQRFAALKASSPGANTVLSPFAFANNSPVSTAARTPSSSLRDFRTPRPRRRFDDNAIGRASLCP